MSVELELELEVGGGNNNNDECPPLLRHAALLATETHVNLQYNSTNVPILVLRGRIVHALTQTRYSTLGSL